MQTDFLTVPKTATLKEAVALMIKNKSNGAVVINGGNKVAGILSSWDMIQHVVPNYLEEDKHLAAFEAGDTLVNRVKEVANDPVSKFMTKKVQTIFADDNLMKAATMLSEFHIRQLPVVDANGVLIGYLNRTDIKKVLGEILETI